MRPLRKVPVVTTTARAATVRPSRRRRPAANPRAARAFGAARSRPGASSSIEQLGDLGLLDLEVGLALEHLAHLEAVCCLSHCARGDQTAGPREVLSRRNWMPTASVTSPMMPPRASISRTMCPLAMPPTAGLQDICAIRSALMTGAAPSITKDHGLQPHVSSNPGNILIQEPFPLEQSQHQQPS